MEADAAVVGSAEPIAAGALLAMISISIVPHAFSEVSGLVATATVLGFVGGYLLSYASVDSRSWSPLREHSVLRSRASAREGGRRGLRLETQRSPSLTEASFPSSTRRRIRTRTL
jgi:hypothetical protein